MTMSAGKLKTDNQFTDPDTAFRLIVEAHRGVSDASSAAINAKLVLILSNHIGDVDVLKEALLLAKRM